MEDCCHVYSLNDRFNLKIPQVFLSQIISIDFGNLVGPNLRGKKNGYDRFSWKVIRDHGLTGLVGSDRVGWKIVCLTDKGSVGFWWVCVSSLNWHSIDSKLVEASKEQLGHVSSACLTIYTEVSVECVVALAVFTVRCFMNPKMKPGDPGFFNFTNFLLYFVIRKSLLWCMSWREIHEMMKRWLLLWSFLFASVALMYFVLYHILLFVVWITTTDRSYFLSLFITRFLPDGTGYYCLLEFFMKFEADIKTITAI